MTDYESVVRRLREANPVASLTSLHEEELQAVRSLLDRRRGKMTATSTPSGTARRWRRPALVVGTAFIVSLAAVGTTLLLLRGDGEEVIATTTNAAPTTTLAPTTTAAPGTTAVPQTTTTIATPAVPGEAWQLGAGPGDAAAGGLSAVASTDTGFIAVGMAFGESDTRPDMIAWSSSDGVSWSREEPDQASLSTGSVVPYAVIDAGDLIVAGGIACDDPATTCPGEAALWTSADAVVWDRVPHDRAVFGEAGFVKALDLVGDRVIALGEVCDPDPASVQCLPVVWQSQDGTTWSMEFEGPEADMVTINEGRTARFQAATAGPEGSLVVVGGWCEGDASTCTAAVWRRDAGGAWERVVHDPQAFPPGSFMKDVISGPGGLVAVGIADLGDAAAIWNSPDGRSWTLVSDDGPRFQRAGITSITWTGDRYVAVGPGYETSWCGGCFEEDGLEPCAVWTSPTGRLWDRMDLDQMGLMVSVAAHENRLVSVGVEWGTGGSLWISPPPPEP